MRVAFLITLVTLSVAGSAGAEAPLAPGKVRDLLASDSPRNRAWGVHLVGET